MCLILFSHNHHDQYKLVVAGNRDEFYKRPTQPATFWDEYPHLLAGRDLTAGGTWMGVTRSGKIAMITNFRDLQNINPDAPSRGHLVSDFLLNGEHGGKYLEDIPDNGRAYNGYNLITGTVDEMYYQSNYAKGVDKIEPGIHGLSNHLLNTPWPKLEAGKDKLAELLNTNLTPEKAFEALYDNHRFEDESLPDTGVGIDMERMLSSMFIKSPEYGSRISTFITVDYNNQLEFHERTYDTRDFSYEDRRFRFEV